MKPKRRRRSSFVLIAFAAAAVLVAGAAAGDSTTSNVKPTDTSTQHASEPTPQHTQPHTTYGQQLRRGRVKHEGPAEREPQVQPDSRRTSQERDVGPEDNDSSTGKENPPRR